MPEVMAKEAEKARFGGGLVVKRGRRRPKCSTSSTSAMTGGEIVGVDVGSSSFWCSEGSSTGLRGVEGGI